MGGFGFHTRRPQDEALTIQRGLPFAIVQPPPVPVLFVRLPARRIGSAHEVYRGLDYSSEIINDGVIDGTVFLGLDRRSFLSTACVKQADIQSVVNDAEELQEYRQRAAATAGKDATAAAALTAIEEYHRDTVGSNRSNSTKPLRTGTVRLEDARVRLQEANEAHANYVAKLGDLEALEAEAGKAERDREIVEAAIRSKAADEAQRKF